MDSNLGSKMEKHEFGTILGELISRPTPELKQFIDPGQTKESFCSGALQAFGQ